VNSSATGSRARMPLPSGARSETIVAPARATIRMLVKIIPQNNGPIRIEGEFEICDASGAAFGLAGRTVISLCRCGQSENKPFCEINPMKSPSSRLAGTARMVLAKRAPGRGCRFCRQAARAAKMKSEKLHCNANSTSSSNVMRKASISPRSRKSQDATRKRGPWTKLRSGFGKPLSCALEWRVRPNRVWSSSAFSASRLQHESKAAGHRLRPGGCTRRCCRNATLTAPGLRCPEAGRRSRRSLPFPSHPLTPTHR
jgi:hypothetical protein